MKKVEKEEEKKREAQYQNLPFVVRFIPSVNCTGM